MKFLFLIGVEGTGHHMIGSVLSGYKNRKHIIYEGDWHHLLIEHWDVEARFSKEQENKIFSTRKSLKDKLKDIFEKYESQASTHLFEFTSFPYNQPRSVLRRPDISEFSSMMEGIVDVKYLVLYRNPVAATYSAIRRNFTDNIYLQARIVESNFIYIERQFSQIPDTSYRVLHFEEFLTNPEHYGQQLADWWELDQQTVANGLTNLRKPSGLSKIPDNARQFLEQFFDEKCISQWQHFYSSNKL